MKHVMIKRVLRCIPVVLVTVIAGYGLWIAPSKASDHLAEDLQKEFAENQELLKEKDENVEQTSANPDTQDESETASEEAEEVSIPEGVTFVGDSVMLGAVPDLMEAMPESVIDAKESRQVTEGVDILKGLEQQDKLYRTVVIELGTNCYFNPERGQEIIDYLGKDRKIYWVSIYGQYLQDMTRTNQVISGLADENDNVEVIRWDEEGTNHPEWFYNDGIHLNGEGRKGFADLMKRTLQEE